MAYIMTYKDAAKSALDVQNGSNPSGIIKTLAGPVLDAVWDRAMAEGQGSRWVGSNPIVKLYLYKICELTGLEASSLSPGYEEAEEACKLIMIS